jgi:hypothetical protein
MVRPDQTVKPDQQDHTEIERKYGPLSANASDAEAAERYRLAQAARLIRLLVKKKR